MSECTFILLVGQKYHRSFQDATRRAAKPFLICVVMKSFLFLFMFISTGRIFRRGANKQEEDSMQKALFTLFFNRPTFFSISSTLSFFW
jgi:hypothetical protein